MGKPLHSGHAAESGVLVALAAEKGVTGAADILDGARGFGSAMSNSPDWSHVEDDLGQTFNITRMTVKNYSACGLATFAAIDAIREIRKANSFSPSDVKKIRIGTYGKARWRWPGIRRRVLRSRRNSSLPYCVAVAFVTGSARLSMHSRQSASGMRKFCEVMSRIELYTDPRADAAYPKQRAAIVGKSRQTTDAGWNSVHPRGRVIPTSPLTDAPSYLSKFHELVASSLGESKSAELLGYLMNIDRLDEIRTLPLR